MAAASSAEDGMDFVFADEPKVQGAKREREEGGTGAAEQAGPAAKRRKGGGRPAKSTECLADACPRPKCKGSKCCEGHKPDYQNLYNDARAKGTLEQFNELMTKPEGGLLLVEAFKQRTGEAERKILKLDWTQYTAKTSKEKSTTNRIKYKWFDIELFINYWKRKRGWTPEKCKSQWRLHELDKKIRRKTVKDDEFPDKLRIPVGEYSFEDKKKSKGKEITRGGKQLRGCKAEEAAAALRGLADETDEDDDGDECSLSDLESSEDKGEPAPAAPSRSRGSGGRGGRAPPTASREGGGGGSGGGGGGGGDGGEDSKKKKRTFDIVAERARHIYTCQENLAKLTSTCRDEVASLKVTLAKGVAGLDDVHMGVVRTRLRIGQLWLNEVEEAAEVAAKGGEEAKKDDEEAKKEDKKDDEEAKKDGVESAKKDDEKDKKDGVDSAKDDEKDKKDGVDSAKKDDEEDKKDGVESESKQAESLFRSEIQAGNVLPVTEQSLGNLHCRPFLLTWIEELGKKTTELSIKGAAATWSEQANAVKIMIGSMTRSKNDLNNSINTRAKRKEKELIKAQETERARKEREDADRVRRQQAEAVLAAKNAARLASGKVPVAWKIFTLERLKERMMDPYAKLEDLSELDSSTPFVFKLDINPQTEAKDRTKLQTTLNAWFNQYKRNNPKYNVTGVTYHELLPAQGSEDAHEHVKMVLTAAKISRHNQSSEKTLPYLFGFHETLQHAGIEPHYRASVYMHASGNVEYVIVSATTIEKSGLSLSDFHNGVTDQKVNELEGLGCMLYGASIQAGMGMYVPAGWMIFTRVLSGTGDNNSVAGLRFSMYAEDAAAKGCLESMQKIFDKGVPADCPLDLKPRAVNLEKARRIFG